ncbi:MAG: hypothetical protein B9S34_06695 [Opitutia bacterium Tous-C1TDCM]|nr:MAG: hypothetical protein B9S34_06695 [Opitutae bacterium Tous-C1TDCM]
MPRLWIRWLFALVAAALPLGAAAADLRFSLSLAAAEKTAAGLARLSSDEVAVIDALVRRDTARLASAADSAAGEKTFAQRLTADERRTSGIAALPAEEAARLDTFVARFQAARLARTLLRPPAFHTRATRIRTEEAKRDRAIHGSFSLSYGWGKGGYSEKTGSMVLNWEDPDRGIAVSFAYTESHIKGGGVYRDPYYDPFYRDPFATDGLRRLPDASEVADPFHESRRRSYDASIRIGPRP